LNHLAISFSAIMPKNLIYKGDICFACELCGRILVFPKSSGGHVEVCPHCVQYIDVPLRNDASLLAEIRSDRAGENADPIEIEPPREPGATSRTNAQLRIEVIAVLCLVYLPYFIDALIFLINRYPAGHTSVQREFYLIIGSLQIAAPLLLIMSLTKEPWSRFGIRRPKWIVDVFGGVAICSLAMIARVFIYSFLPLSLLAWSPPHGNHREAEPEGIAISLLIVLAILADAFSEELAMRAYLIPRLETLLRSKVLAVLVSTLLFASYHLYQGVFAAIGSAAIGLVFGIAFCFCRRLWPLVIAHAFVNLIVYFGR
jgi:membrane protease YdiL (CAAX protease family)